MSSDDDYSSEEDLHIGLGGIGFKRKRAESYTKDGAVYHQKISFSHGGTQKDLEGKDGKGEDGDDKNDNNCVDILEVDNSVMDDDSYLDSTREIPMKSSDSEAKTIPFGSTNKDSLGPFMPSEFVSRNSSVDSSKPVFKKLNKRQNGNQNNSSIHLEASHESKYGIGAKLLQKMGYVAGRSLGNSDKGLVEPIQQKLRPTGLGLGGIKEKSGSQDSKGGNNGRSKKQRSQEDKFKHDDKFKSSSRTPTPRNLYKTIDEMESSGLHVPQPLRSIIDMSQGTEGVTRDLGEVRLSDSIPAENTSQDSVSMLYSARNDLENFSKEWRSLQARKKFIKYQNDELESNVDDVMRDINELKDIIQITTRIYDKKLLKTYSIESVADDLDSLQYLYINSIDKYSLDAIAVASLSSLFEKEIFSWDPLDDPVLFRKHFLRWELLLKINKITKGLDDEETSTTRKISAATTTPFESLIHTVWLPKVQSVLTNSWDITKPACVLLLLEEWEGILPLSVKKTLVHQTIVPKLKDGIASWDFSSHNESIAFSSWFLPWSPILGTSFMEELLDLVKQKLVLLLRHWRPSKGSPINGVEFWRELLGTEQFDDLMSGHLVPRLCDYLRKYLMIDPAEQDIEPMQHVVGWSAVLRPTLIGHILEEYFFPKWMKALHSWLIQPDADFEEISTWLQTWSDWFQEDIRQLPQVRNGFRRGFDLINSALDLSSDDRPFMKLHPDSSGIKKERISSDKSSTSVKSLLEHDSRLRASDSIHPENIVPTSFRDVVEEYCLDNELFLIPLRRAHDKLGHALYKVSKNPNGSNGITTYFAEDVLWLQTKSGVYEPISLDNLKNHIA